MDQPPVVAFTAFADVWPRATETEIGAALCAIGAGRTLTFLIVLISCLPLFFSVKQRKMMIESPINALASL